MSQGLSQGNAEDNIEASQVTHMIHDGKTSPKLAEIPEAQAQKQMEMELTGMTYKNVQEYQNILQKTNSDRFTSLKKKSFAPIKMNKFSSSGIGRAAFSPTPAGIPKEGAEHNSDIEATEMIEQTDEKFVEYELRLNNQEQFEDEYQSDGCSEKIEEDIVEASVNSKRPEKQELRQNLRDRLKARQQNGGGQINESDEQEAGPKFGTQIVNYKPPFVEKSESDESNDNRSKERIASQGKRTF